MGESKKIGREFC